MSKISSSKTLGRRATDEELVEGRIVEKAKKLGFNSIEQQELDRLYPRQVNAGEDDSDNMGGDPI